MASQLPLWTGESESISVLPHDGVVVLFPTFFPDADAVFDSLLTGLSWETHHITLFGKTHEEPRRSVWFHTDNVPYRYSRSTRIAHPFTPVLTDVMQRCERAAGSPFNSVLANLYRNGNDAMGWHADDEPELGREPVIASVSLGAQRRFDFRHTETREVVSVELPHGSLLVMSGLTQHKWMHRIARTTRVSERRINLTFRYTHSLSSARS